MFIEVQVYFIENTKIFFGLIIAVFLLMHRQYVLKRENKKLQDAYSKINKQQIELEKQRNITQIIFNHSQDAILFFEDNKFTDCNESAVKMFKYSSKEELLSHSFVEFSPKYQPDGQLSSQKAEKMMATAFKNGVQRFEWINKKATGEEFWVEITLTPIVLNSKNIVHVIWKDISTQKKLEEANELLNQSLETKISEAISSLNKAQTQAKIGSWELNIKNNKILCSDEMYNIFGMTKNSKEASHHLFLNSIHPDDKDKVNQAFLNSLETKEAYNIIHRIITPNGTIKYVRKHCETNFDKDGNALSLTGTIQDITSEQTTKEELEEKEEMLFRQSRLAQMGEMISMIAHQWRQPLNAISITTASLKLKIENDNYDEFFFTSRLDRVSNYVQHLSSTIEDFRNFFKQNKVKEEFTFEKVIENTLLIIGIELENNCISVESDINRDEVIYSYYNEILQVTLNIIKNSQDALIENEIEKPKIMIRCNLTDDKISLEIEDNAGGIEETIIENIFEPYYTTKNEHEGTGLGLYMSKTIIEEHCSGVLSVKNSDVGAVFTITLNRNK